MNQLNDKNSLIHNLLLNSKGKLIWTDSLESLQDFVEEVLNLTNGKWSSPGADTKMYENQDVVIKWHMKTQTLAVHEGEKSQIEEKLMSLALISKKLASNLVNIDAEQTGHVDESIICPPQHINSSPSLETLSNQLEALSKDVNANMAAIKSFTEHANAYNTEIDNLKIKNLKLTNENSDLKNENDSLKERVNNLSYILADLQGKVKNANEEKDSLITAMKLLVEDLNNKGNRTNLNRDEETEQSSLQMTNDIQQTNNQNKVSKTVFHPSINLSNRFSFDENDRSDQDTVGSETERTYTIMQRSTQTRGKTIIQRPEEVSDTEHRVSKCTQATSNQSSQKPQREQNRTKRKNRTQHYPETPTGEHQDQQTRQRTDDRNRPNIVVVGDSIIKHIEPAKLRQGLKSRLTFRTFSGANTEDMKHYLQPTLKAKPSHLIIHVGTNDLYGKLPDEIAQDIAELGKTATKQVPGLKLYISELITRSDGEDYDKKVQYINKLLETTCRNQSWQFIKHSNINKSHLNQGGLHLNRRGTAVLAQNIKHCIQTSEKN